METMLTELSQSQTENHDESLGPAVSVATTARLHFGFFDPSGRTARPFGSFGLSLDRPWTRLTLQRAGETLVTGPEAQRAARYLRKIAEAYGIDHAYRLDVTEAIPSHAGLGSGTQLALAVGAAFGALEGLDLSAPEIAGILGRGARSGIGIATFETGGAVLDSGPYDGALPWLVARVPFPEHWRALLIFDPHSKGLDGADEVAAFETAPAYSEDARSALETRVLERALPALQDENFDVFCEEVGYLQARMGEYFAPSQGGIFTSPRVGAVLEALRADGVTGLGQSSWGPTGFAFADSEAEAERLFAIAFDVARARDDGSALELMIAKGRNQGAEITSPHLTSAKNLGSTGV
ncbi:beta-ribofuranosylaminobenzene 5'-phosphate synthase family protein [Methyloceanibacter sp. wino2]|uniref:beta-ribofuranosylaminobenzene 5'-phosphate synthase family protein n=1 Tax=Methyloceanibacter sp. wino2 TaxID=2170729 RepID=UPI001FE17EB1|nr:beta-ribofuranosylaminobenzene 5'-phosphate synthase family protein [Methyloceanibacter sp. wino2]